MEYKITKKQKTKNKGNDDQGMESVYYVFIIQVMVRTAEVTIQTTWKDEECCYVNSKLMEIIVAA